MGNILSDAGLARDSIRARKLSVEQWRAQILAVC